MSSAENMGSISSVKGMIHDENNLPVNVPSEDYIELAASTYVVYMQSRDGAGITWGNELYKTNDAYLKTIDRLYDVVCRLEGVHAFQIDAYLFFVGKGIANDAYSSLRDERFIEAGESSSHWNAENVMMYLDPTYLQEDKSDDSEDGEWRNTEEYNPGSRYKPDCVKTPS